MSQKIKIVHIINTLGVGGAETMLVKLIKFKEKTKKYDITVISLRGEGEYKKTLIEMGIKVISLNINFFNFLRQLYFLKNILKELAPHTVQTWMYHSNLIGGVAAKLANISRIIWSIRDSGKGLGIITKIIQLLLSPLSYLIPQHIICNSGEGARYLINLFYKRRIVSVIPNGFDLEVFYPRTDKSELRKKLDLPEKKFIFGTLARYHPDKDYENLIQAISFYVKAGGQAHFALCGKDLNLLQISHLEESILKRIHILTPTQEVSIFLNALDGFVLPSRREAFPNVLGEAMCCELPCIATNVGDTYHLLEGLGFLVPKENSMALCQALLKMEKKQKAERDLWGQLGRERIKKCYSMPKILEAYESFYLPLCN